MRIKEGDDGALHTAEIPFAVNGTLATSARVNLAIVGAGRGAAHRVVLDLAPGQTGGTIPVSYTSNTHDDISPSRTTVTAWGVRNIVTDDYLGGLTIEDDDPTPAITVTPVRSTVTEGHRATWLMKLATWVDYDQYVEVRALPGPHQLKGGDVPVQWLRQHATATTATKALPELYTWWLPRIRLGRTTITVTVPIARDHVAEGREQIRLGFKIGRFRTSSTVYVAPSR